MKKLSLERASMMYDRNDLIVQTAILYYKDDKTQTEIANQLGISRPTVAKFLKEAKETGIVRISIQHNSNSYAELTKTIKEKYKLSNVIIVPASGNNNEDKQEVGFQCSELIQSNIKNYRLIGIGWGTTIYEYVQASNYMDSSVKEIVPLIGGIGINDIKYHSNHLAFQLAEKYHSEVSYFYAPAIAENKAVYHAFNSSELVKNVKGKAKAVDVAVIGIGNPTDPICYRNLGYLTDEEAKMIKQSGAVGDVLASFFDKEGKEVDTEFSNRMIGLTIDDLKHIPQVIILATGQVKAASIKALLSHPGIVSDIIIDSEIGKLLVE
ncbi:sugar-binding transcriptional regulator [Aerococcus urinae]|nr:sugar-binding transcriptional regulator [Aerococcus urinae]